VSRLAVSVIIASDRVEGDLRRCLSALSRQEAAPPFEVLVASGREPAPFEGLLVGWVRVEERNPAVRRNRAADFAAGDLLAFVDDDAEPAPDWLARAWKRAAQAEIFGGRDPGRPRAPLGERVSDLLLSTPVVGSAVAAHERSPRGGLVRTPSALASCNLFARRETFDRLAGFDESVGYVGEDTDFVARAMEAGAVPELDPSIVVFHRRRAFPGPFLAQRWRYRVKTGRLLARGPSRYPLARVTAFLGAPPAVAAGAWLGGPVVLVACAAVYVASVVALSAPVWRRDRVLLPLAPAAFALHHANYWVATLVGLSAGIVGGFRAPGRRKAPARAPRSTLPGYPK
jgi:GT2 family glycosyltransferase